MPAHFFTTRRVIIFTIGLTLLVLALYVAFNRPPPDPVIEGRKVSFLLISMFEPPRVKRFTNFVDASVWREHQRKERAILAKGLPRESMPLIEDWLTAHQPSPPSKTTARFDAMLRRLGLKTKPVINNRVIAAKAIAARPEIASWSEHLIPPLAHNLTNHDAEVRAASINALREVLLLFPPPDPALIIANVQASLSDGRRLWRFELSDYNLLTTLSSDRRPTELERRRREKEEVLKQRLEFESMRRVQ